MLWDIIRDWFVQYVWGGSTSAGVSFGGKIGRLVATNNGLISNLNTQDVYLSSNLTLNTSVPLLISIGDWLSTMSTILVLAALVLFLFFVVRYLFRLTSGLIRGR